MNNDLANYLERVYLLGLIRRTPTLFDAFRLDGEPRWELFIQKLRRHFGPKI